MQMVMHIDPIYYHSCWIGLISIIFFLYDSDICKLGPVGWGSSSTFEPLARRVCSRSARFLLTSSTASFEAVPDIEWG